MGTRGSSVGGKQPMSIMRAVCGLLWLAVFAFFALGFVGSAFFAREIGGALVCLLIAALAGWYDYRIWTGLAKRLWFIIPL